MKKILSLVLAFSFAGSASAYFRCNTEKCKMNRMADKQARLERQIAKASPSEKEEIQNEIAALREEMARIESQTATASR